MVSTSELLLVEEDEMERIQVATYLEYHPPKLRSGLTHPDPVVETVSLASVNSPEVRYTLHTKLEEAVDSGMLSALQQEAAVYACQAHEKFLPSGERTGYLIGDGAGVGKGRTIAAIIFENYLHGRKRAIWLSVSSDLKYDAKRDLLDIGATEVGVHALNKLKYTKISGSENGNIRRGVIFATYPSLIGESRFEKKTRFKQITEWCGPDFDGVIVFDECHRAKNLCPSSGARGTKTGQLVLELQRQLPLARIVYASATGATEPRNMAYMTRLGLWGTGQTFSTFSDFIFAVENRGVGAMEMVAMDMKLRGLYLARQLSFKGVTFRVEEIELSPQFIEIYDESVKVWMECRRQFARALRHMSAGLVRRDGQNVWAHFWAAHQRFFKSLCISAKVEACVKIAIKAIEQGKCIVIGLQTTGESQTLDYLEDNGDISEFVSSAKAILQNVVQKHFPSYDDNSISASDDFQRMFLSKGEHRGKRRRELRAKEIGDTLAKRRKKASFNSDGGNSNGGWQDDESTEGSSTSENEEYESESEDGLEAAENGNNHDSDERSLTLNPQMLLAELEGADSSDSDGEGEDDGVAEAPNGSAKENALGVDLPQDEDEINPFLSDFTKEDPWAKKQQHTSEVFYTSCLNTGLSKRGGGSSAGQQGREQKSSKKETTEASKALSLVQLMPKKKRPGGQLTSQASLATAEEFIESSNIIDDEFADDDDDGSVNLTEIKTDLLAAIERLGPKLPANTLDQLIAELGGAEFVAEMTGRKGRVTAENETGAIKYEMRNAESDSPIEMMNLVEKDKFMRGEKLVAVISEAASSGISLQSDRRVMNQRPRLHITLELPWSADKAVQQFGRTHRSNQVHPPDYLFLISELAGEKRFASIVAKRLESLGALTHGDRRATESRDLSQFNIDNKYGRQALEKLLKAVVGEVTPIVPPPASYTVGDFFENMRTYLEGVGMLTRTPQGGYLLERGINSIPKFLNRLLGLPVHAQNCIFQYFSDIIAELTNQARVDGTYDVGIMDIGVGEGNVQKSESRKFEGYVDGNNFQVEMHKILLHRGIKWEEALRIRSQHQQSKEEGFYLTHMGSQKKPSIALVHGLGRLVEEGERFNNYAVLRPNTGKTAKPMVSEELNRRFVKISDAEARKYWDEQYHSLEQLCHHKYYYKKCPIEGLGQFCESGRPTRTYFVLSGSVICIWPTLEKIITEKLTEKSSRENANNSKRMQIVRVRTESSSTKRVEKLIGLLVMPTHVRSLVQVLDAYSKQSKPLATKKEVTQERVG